MFTTTLLLSVCLFEVENFMYKSLKITSFKLTSNQWMHFLWLTVFPLAQILFANDYMLMCKMKNLSMFFLLMESFMLKSVNVLISLNFSVATNESMQYWSLKKIHHLLQQYRSKIYVHYLCTHMYMQCITFQLEISFGYYTF